MELFQNANYDFLGKRRLFVAISLILLVISVVLLVTIGPTYGIDFKGGALMYVRFAEQPPVQQIRSALSAKISGEINVQDLTDSQEVVIGTELKDEKELDAARRSMVQTLNERFGESSGKLDLNNAGRTAVADRLRDPLAAKGVALNSEQLDALVGRIMTFRDSERSGLLTRMEDLSSVEGVTPAVIEVLRQETYLASFAVKQVEVVGPKVGADLKKQALLATLYALGGMLVYIAFRFEWIYGVAAVLAVFHDTLITIGAFALFKKEISLSVVAALLTLVGYSMNDTIVVFDRIRENLKTMRRERLEALINTSVNQTLSRTVMTSGLTFLTVLALLIFGGPVLNAFAFALTVGIIIGSYSSIFVASPIVLFWHDLMERRKKSVAQSAPAREAVKKRPAKALK